jgi:hypothetical protein
MANIKGAIPQGAAFDEIWKKAYQKVRESRRLNEEGRSEEARKTGREGQDEMQKLLTMVAQRERALEAKSLLGDNMSCGRRRIEQRALLRQPPRTRCRKAFDSSDFPEATLCSVLAEV